MEKEAYSSNHDRDECADRVRPGMDTKYCGRTLDEKVNTILSSVFALFFYLNFKLA